MNWFWFRMKRSPFPMIQWTNNKEQRFEEDMNGGCGLSSIDLCLVLRRAMAEKGRNLSIDHNFVLNWIELNMN
jgi:hypothetical protein